MYLEKFLSNVATKESVVGIYGLGYVGLPLAIRYSEMGFKVIGFDIDSEKVEKIGSGESLIEHISSERLGRAVAGGLEATTDFSRTNEVDAIIICVPTPLNKYREPELGFVVKTAKAVQPYLRAGQMMSLESTTYPGTTDEELLPFIAERGFQAGEDFFLVYSPEREDPGNPDFDTNTIPKVVGGHTAHCLEAGKALYAAAIDFVVPVSSTKAAEMTKLLENIYRAVNIGLVNEMKLVADRMDIDIFEVIDAASTKPFGFKAFYPGPGLGGHCIPIDPFYLTWKAREFGLHTRFIELSGEINKGMPNHVVGKITEGLNQLGKAVKGSKILVLGVAYKKNVDDMRESPALDVMELLRDAGAQIAYSDPHIPTLPKMREHSFDLSSQALTPDSIADFDCIVLTTDHDSVDYDLVFRNASLIVDTRGKYRMTSEKLIKA